MSGMHSKMHGCPPWPENKGKLLMPSSFRRLFLDFAATRRRAHAAAVNGADAHPPCHPIETTSNVEGSIFSFKPLYEALERLLQWPGASAHAATLTEALLDPYFPVEMIEKTLFAHVTGMRFYIHKDRPEMQPLLLRDLVQFAEAFLQIQQDLRELTDSTPLSLPLDGRSHPDPSGQWCRMCGTCCEIGGVPAVPPQEVTYPAHWRALLEGTRLDNHQLCPFLFQSPRSSHHFCSIHCIKPVPCQAFDIEDCRARRHDGRLHQGFDELSPLR